MMCRACGSQITTYPLFRNVRDYYFSTHYIGDLYLCEKCKSIHNPLSDVKSDEYMNYYTSVRSTFKPRVVSGPLSKFGPAKDANQWSDNLGDLLSITKKDVVLDYGCGNGMYGEYLSNKVAKVFLYDEFEQLPHNTACINLSTSELSNHKYDIIFLHHVIEHLNNPVEILQYLSKLLTEKGVLVISTPNSQSLSRSIYRKHWRAIEYPRHRILFSIDGIIALSNRSGLKAKRIETTCRSSREMGFYSFSKLVFRGDLFNGALKISGYIYQAFHYYFCALFGKKYGEEIFVVLSK